MYELKGRTWSNTIEMTNDIRKAGYEVYDLTNEYVLVFPIDESTNPDALEKYYVTVTDTTITLE